MEYADGKIYKITGSGLTYYGSTIQSLYDREYTHIHNNTTSSRIIIEKGDFELVLVENFPCENKPELLARERWFIENNDCVNIRLPITSEEEKRLYYCEYSKQYAAAHPAEIIAARQQYAATHKEYFQTYRDENRDMFKQKQNTKFTCTCGGKYTSANKARHLNSPRHNKQ